MTDSSEKTDQSDESQQQASASLGFAILPERQAKVATLVSMIEKTEKDKDKEKIKEKKSEDSGGGGNSTAEENPVIYCLCRSSDCTRFMICCDHCEEWYHGECVGVEEAGSKMIVQYACPPCREKDPALTVIYKEKKEKKEKTPKDKDADKGSSSKKIKKKKKKLLLQEKKMKMKMKMKMKKKEREKRRKKKMKKLMKMAGKTGEKTSEGFGTGERMMTSGPDASGEGTPTSKATKPSKAAQRANRRCGDCEACNRIEDCGKCDFCLDMKKFGGPNRIRQKCRLKQCIRRASKNFLKPFAKRLKTSGSESSSSFRRWDSATSQDTDTDNQSGYRVDIRLLDHHDYALKPEENPEEIKKEEKKEKAAKEKKERKERKEKKAQEKLQKKKEKKQKEKKEKEKKVQRELRKRNADGAVKRPLDPQDLKNLHQCYGPGCTKPSRSFSKYCSEECGLKLATNRIIELLPQRIKQWQQSPCIAEENNKKSLEQLRKEMDKVKYKIEELDGKITKLQSIIVKAKRVPINMEQDSTDGEDEPEYSLNCVTCGHSINPTKALMHMSKCFRKYESQTSYGSAFKTRIVGESMFCDNYNAQQNTYCKRLKVLCPEHTKEPKVSDKEVCGCPLVSDVFKDTGEYCPLPKRKCNKHHNWEKLRRAEIDLERVRWWLRLDDLLEQERNIRTAMLNRAGVLGLMLHQTINHSLVPQHQGAKMASS